MSGRAFLCLHLLLPRQKQCSPQPFERGLTELSHCIKVVGTCPGISSQEFDEKVEIYLPIEMAFFPYSFFPSFKDFSLIRAYIDYP